MATPPTYLLVLPWSLEHVGGVNQVVLNLAKQAARQGRYRPLVLIADWDALAPVHEEHEGIPTIRWRLLGSAPRSLPAALLDRWLRRPNFRRQFALFCREQNVALVNCHYLNESTVSLAEAMATHMPGIPLVVSVHGADISSVVKAPNPQWVAYQAMLESCRAVVAPSKDLAQRCRDGLKLSFLPQVIHNGVDREAILRSAKARPSTARTVVLSIGKFEHKKGQDVLIQAFSALAVDHPDLELWLVGASAPELGPLRTLAAESTSADRIRFHVDVPHEQVGGLIAAASLFVLPSRQEPFGIVLLEAGCLGIPIVATRVGGIPEIVDDGLTGELVEPDDVAGLAAAMHRSLSDPVSARARADRFAARVEQDFSWRRAYDDYALMAVPPA